MQFFLNIFCAACVSCLIGCGSTKQVSDIGRDRKLYKAIALSPVFSKHHTGFALYDPQKEKWLCRYNADKYFTPASNTKILTLLTCLHVLTDSIETLRYVVSNDTLYFRGMGDPSFLFAEIPTSPKPFEILRQHEGALMYLAEEEIDRFGHGWMWDDARYPFQVERSALPLYGNRIKVTVSTDGELTVSPRFFEGDFMSYDVDGHLHISLPSSWNYGKKYFLNGHSNNTREIPFVTGDFDITRLLSDTLHRWVGRANIDLAGRNPISVYGAARDTLLTRMMHESDNMIAEQLLMQCAFYMRGTMDSDSAIAVAKNMILGSVPDPVQWFDGSGLSRYNLMTPRSIVAVLEHIAELQTMDYVTRIFPAGGQSGTISDWDKSERSDVFAKTGTLRNNHCLSGYLLTDRGKWLIFSFMHNNFTVHSSEIKKEMERIMFKIKEKY